MGCTSSIQSRADLLLDNAKRHGKMTERRLSKKATIEKEDINRLALPKPDQSPEKVFSFRNCRLASQNDLNFTEKEVIASEIKKSPVYYFKVKKSQDYAVDRVPAFFYNDKDFEVFKITKNIKIESKSSVDGSSSIRPLETPQRSKRNSVGLLKKFYTNRDKRYTGEKDLLRLALEMST